MVATEAEAFLRGLRLGAVHGGTVTALAPSGASVVLDGQPPGPALGLIRVPELAWTPCGDPAGVVCVRERVTVQVLRVDAEGGLVSLSRRALRPDPLPWLAERLGARFTGRVTRVAPSGIRVLLPCGVEGLVPAVWWGELPRVEPGDELAVTTDLVDPAARRVWLLLAGPGQESTIL
ncbi:S1 RNA-binding domain-containing protein [Streptomyces sp. MS19]|uniref:S1 RNA-binding domain-containing protein n=1 Tax=Streptomyces sp. MS19 TaxID=3385972 RepID=UPI0039A06B94